MLRRCVWIDACDRVAMTSIETREACRHAREQLTVAERYGSVCVVLATVDKALRSPDVSPLVPIFLPVHLTPRTRVKLEIGIERSFAQFVIHLNDAVRQTNVMTLDTSDPETGSSDAARGDRSDDVLDYLGLRTGDRRGRNELMDEEIIKSLGRQVSRQLDRDAEPEPDARRRIVEELDLLAVETVNLERSQLRLVRAACVQLGEACLAFGRDQRGDTSALRVTRRWLRAADRNGTSTAVRTLSRRRRLSRLLGRFELSEVVRAFESTTEPEDEIVERVHATLVRNHARLVAALARETTRLNRLIDETSVDDPCWCGVTVARDECAHGADEPLIQAPAHLKTFAHGRLRLVVERSGEENDIACGLAPVRLVRVLARLLRDGHLPLDRLGASFAQRLVTCEFAKYEDATERIERETLEPLGTRVGVPYPMGLVAERVAEHSL